MPAIDFRQARACVRLLEVLDLLGFAPRSRWGHQLRGPCPVHRSQTRTSRSFAAHLGRDVWHCFACRASGNALDLWVAVTHQDIHAAMVDLFLRLGRDVPWLPGRGGRGCRRSAKGEQAMPDP
jgi:hypothetical protein